MTANITNPVISDYIYESYRPLNDELRQLRDQAEADNVPIILPDAEGLILAMARLKAPQRVLEIGTAIGYSALCMAYALPEAKIVTLERSEDMAMRALDNIDRMGMSEHIRVVCCDAADEDSEIWTAFESAADKAIFDMVFIDAAKSRYRTFWDMAVRYCKPGALIISDNVLLRGATASDEYDVSRRFMTNKKRMREYLEYINSLDDVSTCIVPVGDGVAVSII